MKQNVDKLKLSLKAYETILDRILNGTFRLGAPLTRRRLSEMLEMSLVPVAEALKRLEVEGFVESLPRVGTRVKIPQPDEIRGHYVVREALEAQVARLFAEHATEDQRRRFVQDAIELDGGLARYFDQASPDTHAHEIHRQHLHFHMSLAEATQCPILIQQIQNSHVLLFNWRYTVLRPEALPDHWHRQLAEALAGGTAEQADQAMRAHVQFRREEVIERSKAALDEQRLTALSYRGPNRRPPGQTSR